MKSIPNKSQKIFLYEYEEKRNNCSETNHGYERLEGLNDFFVISRNFPAERKTKEEMFKSHVENHYTFFLFLPSFRNKRTIFVLFGALKMYEVLASLEASNKPR